MGFEPTIYGFADHIPDHLGASANDWDDRTRTCKGVTHWLPMPDRYQITGLHPINNKCGLNGS